MKEVNKEFDAKMQKTIDVVMSDFASVRAGRANAAVLDKIENLPKAHNILKEAQENATHIL